MSTSAAPSRVSVGLISGAHGLRGEVRVQVLTDRPAARFAPGSRLLSGSGELVVSASRPAAGGGANPVLLVAFEGVGDRNAAEALGGTHLEVAAAEARASAPGAVLIHRLIGLPVLDADGIEWGRVEEVRPHPSQDVLVVARDGHSWLLPASRQLIAKLDVKAGAIRLRRGVSAAALGALS